MFPFYISFKRPLNVSDPNSLALAFDFIKSKLEKLKVDKIICKSGHIDFKNSFFNGQGTWNLMAPINSGYFDYNKATLTIKYSISTITGFVFSLAFYCIVY